MWEEGFIDTNVNHEEGQKYHLMTVRRRMFICVYSGERLEKSNDTWSFREPSRVLN